MKYNSKITIYKNGFQVGNGEFRPLTDKKNVGFLEDLKEGHIPRELEQEVEKQLLAEGAKPQDVTHVGVELVNKQAEEYVPKFDFKQTVGMAVGIGGSSEGGMQKKIVPKEVKIDESKDKTVLQLVLHPRERVRVTFNQANTVRDLFAHMAFLSKLSDFSVLANFPPQPLTNLDQTLKEAGLLNASVQQRV